MLENNRQKFEAISPYPLCQQLGIVCTRSEGHCRTQAASSVRLTTGIGPVSARFRTRVYGTADFGD